jgi:hypothetical protein
MYDNLNAEDIKQNTDMLVRLHGEFADFSVPLPGV